MICNVSLVISLLRLVVGVVLMFGYRILVGIVVVVMGKVALGGSGGWDCGLVGEGWT